MDIDYVTLKVSEFFDGATTKFEYDGFIITIDKTCAYFFIYNDDEGKRTLYIDKLYKCNLSGNQILERFDKFVEQLNKDGYNIKYITLTDASYIIWKSRTSKITINLARLKIISNGLSWYNSRGYYQEKYNDEKLFWDLIRESSFGEFLNLDLIKYQRGNVVYSNFAKSIGKVYNDITHDEIIQKGIELIFRFYKDNIRQLQNKTLISYIERKYLIETEISDYVLMADSLIFTFIANIINYDKVLVKLVV